MSYADRLHFVIIFVVRICSFQDYFFGIGKTYYNFFASEAALKTVDHSITLIH